MRNDERDKHPFYSTDAVRKWKKRIRILEQQEIELRKRHRKRVVTEEDTNDTTEEPSTANEI